MSDCAAQMSTTWPQNVFGAHISCHCSIPQATEECYWQWSSLHSPNPEGRESEAGWKLHQCNTATYIQFFWVISETAHVDSSSNNINSPHIEEACIHCGDEIPVNVLRKQVHCCLDMKHILYVAFPFWLHQFLTHLWCEHATYCIADEDVPDYDVRKMIEEVHEHTILWWEQGACVYTWSLLHGTYMYNKNYIHRSCRSTKLRMHRHYDKCVCKLWTPP